MKEAVLAMLALLLVMLTGISVYTVYGREIRKSELEESMTNAMEETMRMVYEEKTYPINSEKEMIADFILHLCYQMNSDGDLELEILHVDFERGLLDVKATEKFRHFTGRIGTITCRRTIILEQREYGAVIKNKGTLAA